MKYFGSVGWVGATALSVIGLCISGCNGKNVVVEPRPGLAKGVLAADADTRAEQVRRDPRAYLRSVAQRCSTLQQYTLTFTRVERRGLLQTLRGPETIECKFRRTPFSVYMHWVGQEARYGESVYVEGQADNKVRFVPRRGLFGLPPGVTAVDLQTPVTWGESQRPLTDFGLERLMQQTLQPLEDAGSDGILTYDGLMTLPQTGRTVHHLHLEYPDWMHKAPIQELYIDLQTDLPAGTILKLASGKIDAAYFYENINTQVRLTDADFVLDAERTAGKSAADKAPSQDKTAGKAASPKGSSESKSTGRESARPAAPS